MIKNSTKKLSFKSETVRVLGRPELGQVAGGIVTTALNCTVPSHVGGVCHHTRNHCHPVTTYMTCPR